MSNEDEQLIERALKVSSTCLLKPFIRDCDLEPIAHDDFNEFRMMLDDQLHLLLDILYQNGFFLRDPAYDNQLVQLRANLILLTCEQTEPNEFFQTEHKILISSLDKLMSENLKYFSETVMNKVIQLYKVGLTRESWKKQFGMLHGFPKFCKILLEEKPATVDCDLMMFMLSVGSNVVSHYDPHYKTIGFKIYCHLIERGDKSLLKEMNIHQVIYSECFPMLRKSSEPEFNDHLYDCLLQAVSLDDLMKTTQWSKFDDVFYELTIQFGHESDGKTWMLLLKKIVKCCSSAYGNVIVESADYSMSEKCFEDLKAKTKQVNLRTLRWIKKLTQMMIRESSRMLNNNDCIKILNLFHIIYIISIFNVDATVLDRQLTDFTKKFILVLMQVARTHQNHSGLLLGIKLFLKTIAEHQHLNEELSICINNIMKHEKFS